MNKRAMPAIRNQAQAGFTLIELIVVIVILGILAATALPKFAGLGGDARIASLNAAKGSLAAEMSMVHGQWLINPSLPSVVNEGQTITITNGYPAGDANTAAAAGLTANDYTITASVAAVNATATVPAIPANGFVVSPKSVANTATALTCFISYTTAVSNAAVVGPPAVAAYVSPPVIGGNLTACQ